MGRLSDTVIDILNELHTERLTYNSEFKRWEVYGEKSVIRNGEKQPLFVSTDPAEALRYMVAVGKEERR